jgi:hypothetical protein
LFVEDDIGRNDIITANVCHTEGEPQMSVEVKIEAEGPWDEDGAPDFAATLMVDGEPLVEWEVIENEAKPHFLPVTIPKIRWNSTQLILREVDDESEDEFAKYGTLWEFYLADWFCSRNKKWKFKPEEDPRKATTRLIIKKCL